MGKIARQINERNFGKYILEGIKSVHKVEKRENGSYTIYDTDFGTLDIYPKSDKLLFRKDNKWISNGAEWICNNL